MQKQVRKTITQDGAGVGDRHTVDHATVDAQRDGGELCGGDRQRRRANAQAETGR
jgi:hypothetical protein